MIKQVVVGGLFVLILGCDLKTPKHEKSPFSKLEDSIFLSDPVKPESLKGQVVIVNFWASWCEPCQREMPALLKRVGKHPGRLSLLLINADASVKDAKKFLNLFPQSKTPGIYVIHDIQKEWAESHSVTGLPETYVYNQNHVIVKKIIGSFDFDSEDFQKVLADLGLTN